MKYLKEKPKYVLMVRDYGDPEKAADLQEKWENNGYQVISMANDWRTIYGDGVEKTGLPGAETASEEGSKAE